MKHIPETIPVLLVDGHEISLPDFLAVPENLEGLDAPQLAEIKSMGIGVTWSDGLHAEVKRIR